MQPGRYTELFFLDEATALAAGHRPCALCRRRDYVRFVKIWQELHPGQTGADAIDAQLQIERVDPMTRGQRHHEASSDGLPDGTFVLVEAAPYLVLGDRLLRWTPAGCFVPLQPPAGGKVGVIPPASLVSVLRHEREPLVPFIHPSASPRAR
jgi:hypothetical protein